MENSKTIVQHTLLAIALLGSTWAAAIDFNISTGDDFNEGNLQSIEIDADGNVQISSTLETFPLLWVANAGEDSVSKINTDTDCEVGRYETWFSSGIHSAFFGPAPSRTSVDRDGNVFVANRHFDGKPVAILKILQEGGIDRNGNGVIDTSADANGDCVIQPGEMIPLVDTNGNGVLDDEELADERVAFVEQIPGTAGQLGRSLCIDPQGDVWAGTYNGRSYYELDPKDGSVKSGPISTGFTTNYGCFIDSDGILFGASLSTRMVILDTNTNTLLAQKNHPGGNYGIAGGNGRIYIARARAPYLIYDPNSGLGEPDGNPATGSFLFSAAGGSGSTLGIGVDGAGDIVRGQTVISKHNKTTDAEVWRVTNPSGSGNTRGILADSNNNIWAVNLDRDNVTKFSGSDGQFLNTVPVGESPYTYSDATGIGAIISVPTGIFSKTLDGVEAGTEWDSISWNTEPGGSVPAGTSIEVDARAADAEDDLPLEDFTPVNNGQMGLGLEGQFLQLRARLTKPSQDAESPVLSNIVVSTVEDAIDGGGGGLACDINNDGFVDRTDIGLIRSARNTAAAPGDPRDNDGNGVINVRDMRQCVLQCAQPRCAPPI